MPLYVLNNVYFYEADEDNWIRYVQGNGVISGCAISAQGTPNMSVSIAAGSIQYSGGVVTIGAVASQAVNASDPLNPRIDMISITSAGVVTYTAGTAAATPIPPSLPATSILIGYISVSAGAITIVGANLTDRRLIIPAGFGTQGPMLVVSTSAIALQVGPSATVGVLTVNANAASAATGISITSAAAASGVAIAVTSSGLNEAMTLDAKGSGTISIGSVSTGAITLGRATTITTGGLTVSAGGITVTGASSISGTLALTNSSPFSVANGQTLTVSTAAQTVGAATLTIPNFAGVSDTFAFIALAQTLSAKTLSGPTLSGTVSGTPTWASSQAITLSTAAQPNVTSLGTLTSLSVAAGTAGAPAITLSDSTTGLFRAAANAVSLSISGTEKHRFHASGGVSFSGTVDPGANTISVNGVPFPLTGIANSIVGNVTLAAANTYYDGPSVAQGTSGKWSAFGTVTVTATSAGERITAKLWDGTTVVDSAEQYTTGAGGVLQIALSGLFQAAPAGNIRISVATNAAAGTSTIDAAAPDNPAGNTASTVSALRYG